MTMTSVCPAWVQDIMDSYLTDEKSVSLLQQLSVRADAVSNFTLHGGLLRHKGAIWIGADVQLQ